MIRDSFGPALSTVEGTSVDRRNWHITLVYIGDFPEEKIPDLLSAVELSNVEAGQGHDSAKFRELLREDVAGRMDKVRVPNILPLGLLRRWLTFTLVLLAVIGVVLLVPASRNHLLRVAVPWWANIGGIASSHIVLIDPADQVIELSLRCI